MRENWIPKQHFYRILFENWVNGAGHKVTSIPLLTKLKPIIICCFYFF